MKTAIELITEERQRQISQEGWSAEHDDTHKQGELARAAAEYATLASGHVASAATPHLWPWPQDWPKKDTPMRNLVKAGALILAEIERRQRADWLKGEGKYYEIIGKHTGVRIGTCTDPKYCESDGYVREITKEEYDKEEAK